MSKIEFEPTDNKVGCFIYTNLKQVKKEQIETEIKTNKPNSPTLIISTKS